MPDEIRIGLIGAGANTRLRHIPGFMAQDNVEIVGVANRTTASGNRIAKEYNIAKVYPSWLDIIENPDIDAVCIGTWPYMHAPITLAALNEGKHVLCEARMATNSIEANTMLETSMENPDLVCQIVPAPHTLPIDQTVIDLLSDGYLGRLISARIGVASGAGFPDPSQPLHWRHERRLSGNNIMGMGIWYEAIMRWIGPATSVFTSGQVVVPARKDGDGRLRPITIPDHLEILCDMAIGGVMNMTVSTVTAHAPTCDIWLHGTEGVLHVYATDFSDPGAPILVLDGASKEGNLEKIAIPPEKRGDWRVEEEFINAINGVEQITHTSFADGYEYMLWTDAVTESWQTGKKVPLLQP